ncbi:unnamed protein product [Linum trigynum]|uniref:Reverse transcriptase zinc-binding domain-containing protein n=1 Tax=Linum trigynum TaxID=586398 RepID=A0AAV2F3W2_9ROSI
MKKWGFAGPDKCYLCDQLAESRDHIFSTCVFYITTHKQLFGQFTSFLPRSWEDNLLWATRKFGVKKPCALVGRLIWQSHISHILRERYRRAFGENGKTTETLVSRVQSEVRVMVQDPVLLEKYWAAAS